LAGVGLTLATFGLVYAADLFGVATEHRRQISNNKLWQWLAKSSDDDPRAVASSRFARVMQVVVGVGFILGGLAFIGAGIADAVAPPGE
jgi:hypothetical protein